ncbi:RecX domain-containing protein [Cephalotus follicularis]|uniref:Regulatory protein RecX n=1 Tax=Cephalotus follicularis TaxID=3775 RepID=A0A1Q3AV87_CEPFO|nr:RecX domain-containing protein [Cephalotus follicularis]
MGILARNFSTKIWVSLHCHFSYIPWIKQNRAVLCLKEREYSSSMPVKYTPKKLKKVELSNRTTLKNANSLRNGLHEKKHQNPMRGGKNIDLLFNDARQDDELMEEHEKVVGEIRINQQKDIHKAMEDAERSAVELLATRAFTATELRKKLQGKRFPPEIVDAVIDDFHSRGLINDSLYAESFSRSRWSSSSWGPRRIKQALSKKGVNEAVAEKAVKMVFEEGESGEDQELKLGMSKLSMNHLFVQASKQWLRGQDVSKETRKGRMIRWLQYRGFNWGVISFVLKKLESSHPP